MAEPINYQQYRLGTKDGEIKFGHLTADNQIDAVLIRNFKDYKHYIELCRTGEDFRKGQTIIRSPGQATIKAGDNVGESIPGVYIEAVSGDLILRAPSGKVRIEGIDVELTATGYDGTTGNVNVSANEKIIMNAGQIVEINSKVSTKIFSEKTVDLIGKSVLNMYGGMIDAADSAATSKTSKGSKGGSDNEERFKITE
jgi:hypothetical protein